MKNDARFVVPKNDWSVALSIGGYQLNDKAVYKAAESYFIQR